MSFSTRETSLHAGQPVSLYLFELGGNQRWAYCTADRSITLLGITYLPSLGISDDGRRMTGEASADTLKVTARADIDVAQLWRTVPPSDEVWLSIRDTHHGLGDTAADAEVVWVGSISAVRWPQQDRCEIICDSLSASMQVQGLRLGYQRSCPHVIYDCGVSRVLHAQAATVMAADGQRIQHGAPGAGTYLGGMVEWMRNGRLERRGIEAESGSWLTLLGGSSGLPVGTAITLYPGCNGTRSMCHSRFGNLDNHGGFAHLPGKSPFDGDPVF